MSPKEYLWQIEALEIKIKNINDRIKELKQASINMVVSEQGERVQTSGTSDRMSIVDEFVDMADEMNNMIRDLQRMKTKIVLEINQLDNAKYIEILTRRYVNCEKLRGIAKSMNFEYKYLCYLHGHALQDFGRTILNITNNHDT